MKKISLLAAFIAATLVGKAADFTTGGLSYNVISDVTRTLCVVESSSATGDVVIPAKVTRSGVDYSVTEIAKTAFADSKLTSVSIPETVIKIGDGAFMGCNKLKSIVFNATECTGAGTQTTPAFSGCTAVTSVSIGDEVTVIPAYIFQGLTALRSISIPRKVATIGDRAFADCTSVTEIYFDAEHCGSVSKPFDGCTNSLNLIISDNVEEVPSNLCEGSSPKSVTVGRNVKDIKSSAFYVRNATIETVTYNAISATTHDCPFYSYYTNHIAKVVFGADVVDVPSHLFQNCEGLTTVVWNDKIETIGASAFRDCKFVSFKAPKALKKIGTGAMPSTLTSVELNEGLEELSGFKSSNIATVTIPSTVKVIGESAFESCSKLTSVKGLDSGNLETIGYRAFAFTSFKLENFRFSNNLKSIGGYAFCKSTGLRNIALNDGLESVGDYAFSETTAFNDKFKLPNSLQNIGSYAFRSSGIAGTLVLPEGLANCGISAFASNANLTGVIHNSVNLVQDDNGYTSNAPFKDCSVSTVTFGDKVTFIGNSMYAELPLLKEVVMPNSLFAIGARVFNGCTKLSKVVLNEGLEKIYSQAFANCSSLEEIIIPESVNYFDGIFSNSTHLIKIIYKAKECYSSSTISTSVQKLVIANTVEKVDHPMLKSTALKWVKWDAPSITSFNTSNTSTCPVILGEGVKTFFGLGIKTVISNAVVPPALTNPVAGATAYVPDVEAYEEDANWAKYVLRQSVTWSGTIDGQKLTYTTNFPYELTLKHYLDSDGNVMDGTPRELGDYKAIFTYTIDEDEFELISPLSIKANTSNTMFASDVRCHTGRRVVIPVEMVNDQPITSFQFDLYLPKGMTLAVDEYGDYMVDLTSRKSNTHSISTADIDGGKAVRIAAMSMRNQTFSGYEGALVELTVDVATDAPVGDAVLSLRNIRMVEPSSAAQEFFTNRNDATVSIGGFVEGDTNDDGQVTVADVVNTVNMVLGIQPEVFVFAAADLVADGKITISDVVAVMNIAMNAGNKAPKRINAAGEAAPLADGESSADGYGLSVGEVKLIAGESADMTVAMDNVENITAFQFDLSLPEGITVPEDEWGDPSILLSKRASRTHMLVTRYQPDGALRVASYSSKNDPFRQNSGDLLTIELKAAEGLAVGDYNIGFSFIELTNPDATPHYIPDFNVVATVGSSGEVSLRFDAAEMSVRGGNGEIIVSAPEATSLMVCNSVGIVVAQMQVEQGITRLPVAPGFYVVNGTKLVVK